MNENDIYCKMIVPLKKFYVIDCSINYIINLEQYQRYINEPYIQPILEDLYNIYCEDGLEATPLAMICPYVNELIDEIENAENDMMRVTVEDYIFLKYMHKLLKEDDLDFAYFLAKLYLTTSQHEAIINHHNKFNE